MMVFNITNTPLLKKPPKGIGSLMEMYQRLTLSKSLIARSIGNPLDLNGWQRQEEKDTPTQQKKKQGLAL